MMGNARACHSIIMMENVNIGDCLVIMFIMVIVSDISSMIAGPLNPEPYHLLAWHLAARLVDRLWCQTVSDDCSFCLVQM